MDSIVVLFEAVLLNRGVEELPQAIYITEASYKQKTITTANQKKYKRTKKWNPTLAWYKTWIKKKLTYKKQQK